MGPVTPGISALAAIAATLLTLGCSATADAPFTAADGRQSALRVSSFDGSRHTRLAPAEGASATGILHPRASVTVGTGLTLYLQYRSTLAEANVSVLADDDRELARYRLTAGGEAPVRAYLPVPAGPLRGFRVWTQEPAGTLELTAAGIASGISGIALIDGVLHVGIDAQLPRGTLADAGGMVELAARLRTPRIAPQPGRALVVRSTFTPSAAGATGELVLVVAGGIGAGAGEQRATVEVALAAGERSVHLHEAVLGFVPVDVQALSHAGGTVRFLEVSRTAAGAAPLPADLETILAYPRSAWRGADSEVFRWNAFPEVLIFDTASYLIQDELFRRLAYYVEKAGFRGTVWSDADLGERYGYHAHDYTAADLARFFTDAGRTGVQLNARELWLRDFLVRERVIRTAAGQGEEAGWEAGAGAGALLSISQESPPAQRALLLRHEAAHGVYFVRAGYRDEIAMLWQEIGEPARHAWRTYLASLTYDASWEELMRNEFQAYLAHNRERNLGYYFGEVVPARIRGRLPAGQEAAAWFETGAEAIRSQYQGVDRALRAAGGMHAGRLATVTLRAPR